VNRAHNRGMLALPIAVLLTWVLLSLLGSRVDAQAVVVLRGMPGAPVCGADPCATSPCVLQGTAGTDDGTCVCP
jgi:hypothetical protein